jgi:hypothetical protein
MAKGKKERKKGTGEWALLGSDETKGIDRRSS